MKCYGIQGNVRQVNQRIISIKKNQRIINKKGKVGFGRQLPLLFFSFLFCWKLCFFFYLGMTFDILKTDSFCYPKKIANMTSFFNLKMVNISFFI